MFLLMKKRSFTVTSKVALLLQRLLQSVHTDHKTGSLCNTDVYILLFKYLFILNFLQYTK